MYWASPCLRALFRQPEIVPAVSPQPEGSAAVEFALVAPVFLRAAVCDSRDRDHLFRRSISGNPHAGWRAHDPDRSGAERKLYSGTISQLYLQPGRGIVQLQQYLRQRPKLFFIPNLDRDLSDQQWNVRHTTCSIAPAVPETSSSFSYSINGRKSSLGWDTTSRI